MDINIQLFTGSCGVSADLSVSSVAGKLNRILERTKISSALIGWNKDVDMSEITSMLKRSGAEVYLWLPVFSELDELTGFSPIIGCNGKENIIDYDIGNGESFKFYCPADKKNDDSVIEVFEKYYDNRVYDGVFLDKIRFPSFIGGVASVCGCFCDYCRANFDLPKESELNVENSLNPFGITSYRGLRYEMDAGFKKLFDYKCDSVFDSLEYLCGYFRGRGLKIGLDLFSPFLAYFVGQDYYRLLALADVVKPMLYQMTNAPAGLPFEIRMYAEAFDGDAENAMKRKELFTDIIGYNREHFIKNEISGIREIIEKKGLSTKLYAGIELNYNEHIAPVTKEYIKESIHNISEADGIVASWDLNTTPELHIDYLLDIAGE